MIRTELLRRIGDLERETAAHAQDFLGQHEAGVERYRAHLVEAIQNAKRRLLEDVAEITGSHPFCARVVSQTNEYVDWLQWALWDLPYFAVAIRPPLDQLERRIAACGFVYLAGRVFDDVIDRHFWYKARRPTLLSMMSERHRSSDGAEGLTILSGLLLCADGLQRLAVEPDPVFITTLQGVLASFRRAVIGAIMEQSDESSWTPDAYERLVALKNVDFWRCLYSALDPQRESALYPFLERYYGLAQKLNDIQDYPEDERRGQPNLVSILVQSAPKASARGAPADASVRVPAVVEEHLAQAFTQLAHRARQLPALERSIAMLKLGESLKIARSQGVFEEEAPPAVAEAPERKAPSLYWHSSLLDVVVAFGANALESVDCAVCGSAQRHRLFEKSGFPIHRCLECSHVYVSPRLRPDLQQRIGGEDEVDGDAFLEVQRIFAEPICHLLRLRSRGSRLLDLGFGRGYVMKLARAYGFEVYGVDGSGKLARDLTPEFGRNVCTRVLGLESIPWHSFDVIVMSHVAEHLADPGAVLREIYSKLNPGGILYLAVPDAGSIQYKIFGKNWNVVNPLAHLQYFSEASLSRLLSSVGFEALERTYQPALPRELTPGWMRLMRRLGGDESGELAMLARRPFHEVWPNLAPEASA